MAASSLCLVFESPPNYFALPGKDRPRIPCLLSEATFASMKTDPDNHKASGIPKRCPRACPNAQNRMRRWENISLGVARRARTKITFLLMNIMNPRNTFSRLRLALLCGALSALISAPHSSATDLQDIGPLDATLTQPQNPVARNFGFWDGEENEGGTTQYGNLQFRKNGHYGMSFTTCFRQTYFHAQHVVRLPNRNGHAYFAVSSSGKSDDFGVGGVFTADNPFGRLTIYRTDRAPDPVTDLVPINPTGTDGEIVFEQVFSFDTRLGRNGLPADYNHPCKMEMIGNLLLLSAQQWDGGLCTETAGRGFSSDAILFFDVRDPESPKYWGRLTKEELGLDKVDAVSLVKAGDRWILNSNDGHWWHTRNVSPELSSWTRGGTGSLTGQHGQNINSYEMYARPSDAPEGTVLLGTERVMFIDGGCDYDCEPFQFTSGPNHVLGDEFITVTTAFFGPQPTDFTPKDATTTIQLRNEKFFPAPNLFANNKVTEDYDACGVYVTPGSGSQGGAVIIYAPQISRAVPARGSSTDDIVLCVTLGICNAANIAQVWNPKNIRPAVALGTALDTDARFMWTASGSTFKSPWIGQTSWMRDQSDAAMSGDLNDSQYSRLETVVTGPGALRFWWKVSSEANGDFLRFFVDGAEQPGVPGISGEVEWTLKKVELSAGLHTLRWEYAKNGSISAGEDAGFLDLVSLSIPEIVVSNFADAGPGSLRQALVDVGVGGTIILESGVHLNGNTPLFIDKDLTIAGIDAPFFSNGSANDSWFGGVTIDASRAANKHRVFEVAFGATVTLRGFAITGGSALDGGAILNRGTLILDRCTLYQNHAGAGRGGAIYNQGGTLTLSHCTLANNSSGNGGGVFSDGTASLTSTTISDNAASLGGGGLWVGTGSVSIKNTIIARNTGPNPNTGGPGTLTQSGANLIQGDPKLSSLGAYGGRTPTMRLLPGSPAIDAATQDTFATDQRGLPRSRGGSSLAGSQQDIGAYEAQSAPFIVGFNFVGPVDPLAATDTAGAPEFAQDHWNNLTTDFDGTGTGSYFYGPVNLLSANGGVLSPNLRLWWDAPNVWGKDPARLVTSNDKLMGGYLDSNGTADLDAVSNLYSTTGAQPFLAIANLPAALTLGGYKVVVYVDGGAADGRVGKYWISSNRRTNPGNVSSEIRLTWDGFARDTGNFSGAFIQDRARDIAETNPFRPPGNYLVFQHLSEPGLIVRAEEAAPLSGSNARAPINAVQVVRNEIIVVTTAQDELDDYGTLGTGISLREALLQAPAVAGITFDPAVFDGQATATIHLTLGRLNVGPHPPGTGSSGFGQDFFIDASNTPHGVTINASGINDGVLFVGDQAKCTLRRLRITGGQNPANRFGGGGIWNFGDLTLIDCSVSGNTAVSGGGIANWGSLALTGSTLSGNSATTGGAIENWGILTLDNCTLSGNSATGSGGAINSGSYQVKLNNVTISANTASVGGGVIVHSSSTFDNVIVAGNTAPTSPDVAGSFTGSNNLIGGDPRLARLGDFGGPTQTMPPLAGSSAIKTGAIFNATLLADQIGNLRPRATLPNIGAVEGDAAILGNNADLAGLAPSVGTLAPVFASGTTAYTLGVPNAVGSMTFIPTAAQANATIKVNGVTVPSGAASSVINLAVGTNPITISITAQDGATVKSYVVTVTRAAPVILPSSNADLASLVPSAGSLTPGFGSATTGYTVSVPNATSSMTFIPTVAQANATIKVNGANTTSGSASSAISLSVGSNPVTIAITAQNGATVKSYVVTVTRAAPVLLPSSNADLANLIPSAGSLTPGFGSATTGYTVSVPNATSSMTFIPTVAQANATIRINGTTVTSGAASSAITLAVGSNPVTIAVTAQNGTTVKSYVVTVTRATVPVEGTPGLNRLFYRARPGVALADFYFGPRGKGVFPAGAAAVGTAPTQSGTVAKFEAPAEVGEEYGQILHGYIVPSQTGDYTFYLCSDDQGELWLSTDEHPVNSRLIAREPEYNPSRTWNSADRRPVANGRRANVSASIRLEAGKYYYVEAVMKEGTGGDNLGVAWTLTGAAAPVNGSEPIAGTFLRTTYAGPPVPPSRPLLTISRGGGGLIITWPDTPGFILEQADGLAPDALWSNVPFTVTGTNATAPANPNAAAAFYRLRQP
jgi:hypothetical protein